MHNEYLKILGLSPGASESDVKSAYRGLAKKYHPDINKDAHAKRQFIAITEAYKFLTEVGPNPHHGNVSYNYNPHHTEFDLRREKARAYARKRAEEEVQRQQSALNLVYKVFNYVGAVILLFNVVLMVDYLLPEREHKKEIYTITELYYTSETGKRIHKYDQVTFSDLALRFHKNETTGIKYSLAIIEATPIFGGIKEVKLMVEDGERSIIPINRLYKLMKFMIPAVLVFLFIYYYLSNWHYNKNTFALVSVVIFLIQIFLTIRYGV